MSGSEKCACCGLHYVAGRGRQCWFCRNGYDPRGPFVSSADPKSCGHCYLPLRGTM